MRGPTLFSGYWRNEAATESDFRNGWFHMGDLFRRRPDGFYDFVDRAKYMIKSGGENIYPAEIERVLVGHPDVADAVVVRKKDDRWGEIPVALVVANREGLDVAELRARCRSELAGYKQPKEIRIVAADIITRSTTGKVQRKALEALVADDATTRRSD
jgi:fatty-acyl-CoA synthase